MRDWGSMPKEIVTKIVEHVEFYEDFETLQKISSHWRLAAKAAKFRAYFKESYSGWGNEHTLPWLMLPEENEYSTIRRLYSISKKMFYNINFPHYLNRRKDKKRLLSSHGWLLVFSNRGEVSLLNPYSNAIIKLPKIHTYSHGAACFKFTLSANPSTIRDFIVFVYFLDRMGIGPPSNLFYWKNGDVGWIRVTNPHAPLALGLFGVDTYSMDSIEKFLYSRCFDVIFYQGEFYGTNIYGWVVKFETAKGSPHFRVVTKLSFERHVQAKSNNESITILGNRCYYYLVKSLGQLLVICQVVRCFMMNSNSKERRCTTGFEVFELNVSNGKVKEVSSLGNRAFFIGSNSSFAAEVSPSNANNGFKPNCVYYTDNWGITMFTGPGRGGRDHCVYNLATRMFEPCFYKGPSSDIGKLTPFTWLESFN